ncbi:SGNH hydrolase-type esterase domain-containing protein [Crepidotus variabilis]|uniref:SGNH hydrolase-type esterase domain-containing protein n=1 Tax=Crepidotus variabilis TaxID=179855 RepID=A0A9P6ERT6_9AGAR|nr:SGNH hydrolase-type esterase domain-containing protein [Crepidotus variabilis]
MKISGLLAIASLLRVATATAGPNWTGFSGLRYFFVYGDSYTTVGYNSKSPNPTDKNPIGVNYPGQTTSGGPNWVDYTTVTYNQSKVLTFDYAISGNTISGVQAQINDWLPTAGKKPTYAPWAATDSLFATWIGINDLNANAQPAPSMTSLFGLMDTLYTNGARNFLFVNVPPFHRAPFANNNAQLGTRIQAWNTALVSAAAAFQTKHSDVSTFVYDSWALYSKLLNSPSQYGFTDVTTTGGSFWQDVIHPKAKVHDYMAQDLVAFLKAQTATSPTSVPTPTTSVNDPTATPQPTTTFTPEPAPTQPAGPLQTHYGQCGGQGFNGPTACETPYACQVSNQWFSQCL